MFSSVEGKGGMEQLFENKELNVSVRTMRRGEEVLFSAKDVAESLGYENTRKAVRDNVRKQNRTTVGELNKGELKFLLVSHHPDTVLLYEPGLYQFCFRFKASDSRGLSGLGVQRCTSNYPQDGVIRVTRTEVPMWETAKATQRD
jgi:hypothetical protein